MTHPDIRLAKVFLQTERGVIVLPVIMDFNRRAHWKTHRAGAGRPHFWIEWHPWTDAVRRLRHECTAEFRSMAECMRCRLIAQRFAAQIE